MPPVLIANPPVRLILRRVVALALFALQGVVALSPIAERGQSEQPRMHVEEQGATHPFAHSEATCGLCAVRTMHVDVSARAHQATVRSSQRRLLTLVNIAAPSPEGGWTNLSRAPPQAS